MTVIGDEDQSMMTLEGSVKVPLTMEDLVQLCQLAESGIERLGSKIQMMKHLGLDNTEAVNQSQVQAKVVQKAKAATAAVAEPGVTPATASTEEPVYEELTAIELPSSLAYRILEILDKVLLRQPATESTFRRAEASVLTELHEADIHDLEVHVTGEGSSRPSVIFRSSKGTNRDWNKDNAWRMKAEKVYGP